jgi:hypothetical protein
MKQNKILKNYVSEIDQFLQAFDKKQLQLSLSQQKEQKKHRRIYYLRDTVERPEQPKNNGKDFNL